MIEVIYDGNLGNNLFQYCFGRILSETLGYKLVASPIPGFPRTYEVVEGKAYPNSEVLVLRGQKPDIQFLKEEEPKYRILLTGYFQRYDYYQGWQSAIKEWLTMEDKVLNEPILDSDVVVGIRRGRDYIPRHGLPMSYYEESLSLLDFKRVFICTNDPLDPFVQHFQKKYNAIIRPPGAIDNLLFVKQFSKIVISNSTFLWWGAFLSDATDIIFPRPANGYWSHNDILSKNISLEVSEARYSYLECQEYRSDFVGEKIFNFKKKSEHNTKQVIKFLLPWIKSQQEAENNKQYIFHEDFS